MPPKSTPVSEYERKRLETIAKNKALLKDLALDAAVSGLAPPKSRAKGSPASSTASVKRKREAPKVKEEVLPVRTSSRLRGIQADSEVAKVKAEDDYQLRLLQDRAKRQRISGDLSVGDIITSGSNWDQNGNFLRGVAPAKPYERTFDLEDIKENSDADLRKLRERMSGLLLWGDVSPNQIKITPERTYSLAFHPTSEKALVFAGDKLGSLGIFDGSQSQSGAEDDDDDDWEVAITTLKLHTRTISAMQASHTDQNSLYTASYDSTIRRLDLAKGIAVEVYAPSDPTDEEGLSGVQIADKDPNMVYFSTLEGRFGRHDMRVPSAKSSGTKIFSLSEKKIGGFSLHPGHPHLVATASLDRTLKLWDLRRIDGKGVSVLPDLLGEHESRLSVSHAAFNYAGQVVTTSYDDSIKIHDFGAFTDVAVGSQISAADVKPKTVVRHNCQTGRWVTILRAQWQMQPQDNVQKFCIGNMNRFVDLYTSKGEQLAQLGGDGITAVPAVAQFHPSMDWVGGATASGKLCLWI